MNTSNKIIDHLLYSASFIIRIQTNFVYEIDIKVIIKLRLYFDSDSGCPVGTL